MKDEQFNDLFTSVKEGGAILRGEQTVARTFKLDALDIAHIREGFALTQVEFAAMLGISVRTLHNWEQGRRAPTGPAKVLLLVAAKHPEAVRDAAKTG
ncbi:MAG: helix-turn-helix domain-containing protein [Anaerolineae bacterium]